MRFPTSLRAVTILGLAVTTACAGDGPSAPVAPSFDVAGPVLAKGSSTKGKAADAEVLTIDPTRSRVYRFGQNWLYVPAGVVCEAGATYGPSEWDQPCDRAKAPFQLTVTVGADAEGRPTAHFSPDMRFAPSSTPYNWVVLGLKVKGKLDTEGYGILYQPRGSTEWIDESASDSTLRAWRAKGNVIARRIKHFSGYNVSLGYSEQTAQVDGGFFGGAY